MKIEIDIWFCIGFFGTLFLSYIISYFTMAAKSYNYTKEPPVEIESHCLDIPYPSDYYCADHPITNANSSSEGL